MSEDKIYRLTPNHTLGKTERKSSRDPRPITSVTALVPQGSSTLFAFEGSDVRVRMKDGEPWFVAADIARILDIGRTDDAVRRLDDDERGTDTIRTPGGDQDMIIINEAGLYRLVLTSRKESAKRFKKWIVTDVLPAIRKTGSYGVANTDPMQMLSDPAAMRSILLTYVDKVILLEGENAKLAPKAEGFDVISQASGSLTLTEAAKVLQTGPKRLGKWMRANGWLYRRVGSAINIGFQDKIDAGLLEHKATVLKTEGGDKIVEQVRITAKGLTKLAEILPKELRT